MDIRITMATIKLTLASIRIIQMRLKVKVKVNSNGSEWLPFKCKLVGCNLLGKNRL